MLTLKELHQFKLNSKWLDANARTYAGWWVALRDGELCGYGDNPELARQIAVEVYRVEPSAVLQVPFEHKPELNQLNNQPTNQKVDPRAKAFFKPLIPPEIVLLRHRHYPDNFGLHPVLVPTLGVRDVPFFDPMANRVLSNPRLTFRTVYRVSEE